MTTTTTIEITARARYFAGHGLETLPVLVESDGTLRVWDAVAGHYTTCHSLGQSAERRIRRLAKDQAEVRS